jgi:hypothetical protein
MRSFFAFWLLLALPGGAQAQTIQRIEIIEFGIFTRGPQTIGEDAGSPSGFARAVSKVTLVQRTNIVPARIGAHFGFTFRVIGASDTIAKFKYILHIPAPGIRNPNTGNIMETGYHVQECRVGDVCFVGYGLDHDFEIVPGTWTIELWEENHKLASQSFNVVAQ